MIMTVLQGTLVVKIGDGEEERRIVSTKYYDGLNDSVIKYHVFDIWSLFSSDSGV